MSSLSEAKKALQFNHEFVGLIGILKGIAASQFQALTRKRERFEDFSRSFDGFFKLINLTATDNPFVRSQSDVTGVVIVTSDEGFMGGLNTRVINRALEVAGTGPIEPIVLGGRGAQALKDLKLPHTDFPAVTHETRYEQAVQLKDFILERVTGKKIGKLILVYPAPVSLMVQRPTVVHLLPAGELLAKQEDLSEEKGRIFIESSPSVMIQYLVGIWITYRLYDIFEEAKLSEFAARTTHLEQSHDRLTEQGKVLRYRYFRCRRERIDKGMRETFASILLRRNLEA